MVSQNYEILGQISDFSNHNCSRAIIMRWHINIRNYQNCEIVSKRFVLLIIVILFRDFVKF